MQRNAEEEEPMVGHNYPTRAFAISAAITFVVFLAGLLLGWSLDKYRESDIMGNMQVNELDTQSYFLEKDFISGGKNVCEVLNSRIGNIRYTLTEIGSKLPSSEEKSIFKREANLDYLKRKYSLSEVQFLLLLRDFKEKCGGGYIPIIFFYTKDDAESENQGYVLTWANEKYKDNVVVLSFDKDYGDEPLINTLKLHYGVTASSTIVINEGIRKDGFVGKEELDAIIAELLEKP